MWEEAGILTLKIEIKQDKIEIQFTVNNIPPETYSIFLKHQTKDKIEIIKKDEV